MGLVLSSMKCPKTIPAGGLLLGQEEKFRITWLQLWFCLHILVMRKKEAIERL